MSNSLRPSNSEYARMVDRGAFDHLNRKLELIRGLPHVFRNPNAGRYTDCRVARIDEQPLPLQPCLSPLDLSDLFG